MVKGQGFFKAGVKKLFPGHDPSFMVIGAQKAGTSSLHFYLNQHPDLVGSKPKEIHFFDQEIIYENGNLSSYRKYFKNFTLRPGRKIYFESTPNYLYHESAPAKIHRYYPNMKFLIVLREPVSRAFSAWNMYRVLYESGKRRNDRESKTIEKLMKERNSFPTLAEAMDIELLHGMESPEPSIIRRGLYLKQIKNYLKYFPRENILILGYQDLINIPEKTCNEVLEFLHLPSWKWSGLSRSILNKGQYKEEVSDAEFSLLNDFYKPHNRELIAYLGNQVNW